MIRRAISIIGLLALAAGCAAPSIDVSGSGADEAGSALPANRDVAGTWHGSYWAFPAIGNSYGDEADCTLRITKDDATYTVKCERAKIGTNNLERASSWSGHVVTTAHGVVLESNGGPWPSIVLRRYGSDTLYATTLDPLVGATVEMEFERGPHTTAGAGGK